MNRNEISSQPPIDLESALERIGGDKSFLHELIEMYIEDFNPKYSELKKAVEKKDFTRILETGHYLKGSSANLSLEPLRKIAHQVELCGRENDAAQAKETISKLKLEFDRLLEFFDGMKG